MILTLVANRADADDLMQETAAAMWKKFDTFEPGTDFAAWALRIARYQVMNHIAKASIRKRYFSTVALDALADEVVQVMENQDFRSEALQHCIDKLPERDRELLHLRYQPGATIKHVAARVGRSVHTVYEALNRIHCQLLVCIRRTLAQES